MKLLLATNNSHKTDEFKRIFRHHDIISPADAAISFSHEETADTFLGNALGKARALYSLSRKPVFADDSGLVVPALGGEPGIFSARYGNNVSSRELSSRERNAYLLERMKNVRERSAFYVCAIVLILDEYRIFTVQETFHGEISREERGEHGFGYDPVFFIPEIGRTAAEAEASVKDRISHRGRAGRRMEAVLESIECEKNRNQK